MSQSFNRKIVLEDGKVFYGYGFGAESDKLAELVFNTSMVGYQEIISDPSYTDQAVVMTYPLIGNYGINNEDYETERPSVSALIVRDYNNLPSNFRSSETLGSVMKRYDISGVFGIDTRKLVRIIRDYGSCKVLITSADKSDEECMKILKENELRHDQVKRVSTVEQRIYRAAEEGAVENYRVVAIDCGMKKNIVRKLQRLGCSVYTVPWDITAEKIRALDPDGVFISNGPGDPQDAVPVINAVKELKGEYPIFGICLGHQIISLAYGAKTYKLKFGHRGGNHPVKNLITDKVEITSQNHSYAVNEESLAGTGLSVTHINLLDNTVEGTACEKDRIYSVQYHPESAPGPQDSAYLFDKFIKMMEESKNA